MAKTIKDFVRIQSSINIRVTMGLNNQDVTNPDAHVPDRLKINPLWPKLAILIKAGSHWYPSEIVNWATVKALATEGTITIGEYSDTATEDVVKEKGELKEKIKEVAVKTGVTLESLTEE